VRHSTDSSASSVDDRSTNWDRIAPGYDKTNTPTQMWVGKQGLQRAGVSHGTRFLDVASGSGALSIPAAQLGAKVLASDQSSAMLDLLAARAAAAHLDIETRVMDGHALQVEDASFDVVGSQFGVMLFEDMPRGIREMTRAVKPKGRVLVTAYGDPGQIGFLGFMIEAVQSVRPEFTGPPSDPPPLEFQLADPGRLEHELTAAGLHDVTVEEVIESTTFDSGSDLWDWIIWSNPIVEMILSTLRIRAEEREIVRQSMIEMVRQRGATDGSIVLTNPVNIGVGTK
jgi:ubiquinone/menaquinone biosynthesis C-methylase UbiE